MPLEDILNLPTGPSHAVEPASKRTHDEITSADEVFPGDIGASKASKAKKPRLRLTSPIDEVEAVFNGEAYHTLPDATTVFIQLRFQLARFKGVFRIVQMPVTFTFANLHMFILYIFGWSGDHTHRTCVYGDVVMYARTNKPGEIKKCGRVPPMPDSWYEGCHGLPEQTKLRWWADSRRDNPEVEVVPKGMKRSKYAWFEDGPEKAKEDQEITLREVWHPKTRKNITEGACSNEDIAMKYSYDGWHIHISIDGANPFHKKEVASNLPIVLKAKGAPPLEEAPSGWWDTCGEDDPREKRVSKAIFDPTTFEKFLKGDMGSVTRKEELAIYNSEEERVRQAKRAKRKQREREMREQQREQEKAERHKDREERRAKGEDVSDTDDDYLDYDSYNSFDEDSEGA